MSADVILYNQGIQYADGNIVTHAATYPASGSWTTGDIVLEQTSTTRLSGWKRITTGSGNVLGTDWVYCSNLISGTAQATTSGTSITFTGIPSWAKRITVNFKGVGTSGTSAKQVQVGNGSVVTTGYLGSMSEIAGINPVTTSITTGFGINSNVAADRFHGAMTLTLENASTNSWMMTFFAGLSTNNQVLLSGGSVSLTSALDRVVITTVNGTDTFAAGEINIMWE